VRNLYRIFEKVIEKKWMLRHSVHPGGHISVAIYPNVEQYEQFLYEEKSFDELEKRVMKDFGYLLGAATPAPKPTGMPLPPGFPRL
jgi:hypothetical protein